MYFIGRSKRIRKLYENIITFKDGVIEINNTRTTQRKERGNQIAHTEYKELTQTIYYTVGVFFMKKYNFASLAVC